MYHENGVINDIVLAIVNDGNGKQCGMTYEQRKAAADNGIGDFRIACQVYANQRVRDGGTKATREEILKAADILQAYYVAHNAESA